MTTTETAAGTTPAAAPGAAAPAAATSTTPANASAVLSTTPATETTPAATQTPLPPAGTTTANDYKWAGDDAAQAVAKAKGWASPADAIKSYDDLHKLLGGEKVPLPKNDQDKDGWDRYFAAGGRPNTAGEYEIPVSEKGSKELADEFSKVAFDLGLSKKQAQGLAKWSDGSGQKLQQGMQAETEGRINLEIADVTRDWGPNYAQNAEIARRGAQSLGLSKEAIDAMEESPHIGHKQVMNMLLKFGQVGTDAKFHTGQGSSFSPQTKATAEARMAEIKADPAQRSEALKAGSSIQQEVERLNKVIAGVRV